MPAIIALSGIGNSGKTETIHILHRLLLINGFQQVPGRSEIHGRDILDILSKNNKLVGLTSAGDTRDDLERKLLRLTDAQCEVLVCACRTRGGSYDVIRNFPPYIFHYINKTAPNIDQRQQINNNDANTLLSEIIELIATV